MRAPAVRSRVSEAANDWRSAARCLSVEQRVSVQLGGGSQSARMPKIFFFFFILVLVAVKRALAMLGLGDLEELGSFRVCVDDLAAENSPKSRVLS